MFMCVWCFIVVFFFKQKTAYEMRISDWSSDVCSSDLLLPDFTRLCHTRSAGERGAHFSYGDDLRVERAPVVAGVDRGPDRLDLVDQHRTGRAPPIGMVAQIGRAHV